ncbi:AEC family transporter [Luethyella okanaganae]|uniref:AEC family transporter n=1 Tax=Luethyella okanaganae TaxID=69372 RepID=A0ABW1VIP7_9MICO
MSGVLIGFGVVGFIIVLGYVAGRFAILGAGAQPVLSKLAFNFGTPALMFSLLAKSDILDVFTPGLLVVVISSLSCAFFFGTCAVIWRWGLPRGVIGALGSSYVNAGNLGIPIAAYVLGTITPIAPVMLFQLIVLAPVALSILDVATGSTTSFWRRLSKPLTNPITLASMAGLGVGLSGTALPEVVIQPFTLLGQATVPVMLLAFGMSLHGSIRGGERADTAPVALAVVLKSLVQPAIALAISLTLGLSGLTLMAAVLCSSFPTAQNVFIYASRYEGASGLAHRVVLLTTVASIPMLLLLTWVIPAVWP